LTTCLGEAIFFAKKREKGPEKAGGKEGGRGGTSAPELPGGGVNLTYRKKEKRGTGGGERCPAKSK